MKSFLLLAIASCSMLLATAQNSDKSKRPSPPDTISHALTNGVTATIAYSQPSVKGRTIGVDLEPKKGEVWRAGANEATTFEVNKNVRINGKELAAGKYSFFVIDNGDEWTLIFNKTAAQWGAYKYDKAQDALRVNAKPEKAAVFAEKLTYQIFKSGKVTLSWGDKAVSFTIL